MAAGSVTAAVARFVSSEVRNVADGVLGAWGFTARWGGAVIAVVGIVAVINASVEVSGAVVPGSGADEDSVYEPSGSVVAPGGAGVRGVVVVAVRAYRSWSDLDGNLSPRCGRADDEADSNQSGNDREAFESVHRVSLFCGGRRGPDSLRPTLLHTEQRLGIKGVAGSVSV